MVPLVQAQVDVSLNAVVGVKLADDARRSNLKHFEFLDPEFLRPSPLTEHIAARSGVVWKQDSHLKGRCVGDVGLAADLDRVGGVLKPDKTQRSLGEKLALRDQFFCLAGTRPGELNQTLSKLFEVFQPNRIKLTGHQSYLSAVLSKIIVIIIDQQLVVYPQFNPTSRERVKRVGLGILWFDISGPPH